MKCTRCNRPLKSKESIALEYGPVCWKRHLKEMEVPVTDFIEVEGE